MSKDFDAFLYLENDDGEVVAQNDDGGEGLNSRIIYQAPESGTHRVIATHAGKLRPGPFTFTVRALGRFGGFSAKALPSWFKKLDSDQDGQIAVHEWRQAGRNLDEFRQFDLNDDGFITAEEALIHGNRPTHLKFKGSHAHCNGDIEEPTEARYRGKKSYKIFTITLEAGKTYRIELQSKAFQAFIYLEDSGGDVVAENSSPNIGGLSHIIYRALKTGTYRVVATSLGGFRTGQFLVSVRAIEYSGVILPKGLPKWFKELDKDGDGQIALYEWREGGRDFEEFDVLDLNGDGFITIDEVQRHLKILAEQQQ
jgi:hypothetical protein